jgi:hypothetical protein
VLEEKEVGWKLKRSATWLVLVDENINLFHLLVNYREEYQILFRKWRMKKKILLETLMS